MKKIIAVFIILSILLFSCATLEVEDKPADDESQTVSISKDETPTFVEAKEQGKAPVVADNKKEDARAVEENTKAIEEASSYKESSPVASDSEVREDDNIAIEKAVSDVASYEGTEDEKVSTRIESPMAVANNSLGIKPEAVPVIANDDPESVSKQAQPTAVVASPAKSIPKPVLDNEISPTVLEIFSVIIVITVVYTISVAIRSINKLPLKNGISFVLSVLFTALPMIISTIVAGWTPIWLLYLLLLFTCFVFRSSWKSSNTYD